MIIDVSDRSIYNNYHIKGSINIPYNDLMSNYKSYLKKGMHYYLTCKSGKLSKRAVLVLSSLGYNVHMLKN